MTQKYQTAADRLQKLIKEADAALERVQDAAERAEAMTCGDAADGNRLAEQANPMVTQTKAHAMNARAALCMAKASATQAGNLIPDVTLFFGDK